MQDTVVSRDGLARSRNRRRSAGALLAAPLALLVFTAACSSDDGDDTPAPSGTTDAGVLGPVAKAAGEPVKIGVISDGQSASIDNSIQFDVADATAAFLNEHRSGIGGRPIELVECETQADPARGADCGNQMIEEGVVAVAVGESGVAESVWQPLSEADVPVMFFGAGSSLILADDTSFAIGDPTYATIRMPLGLAEEQGATKVTTVVIDVPAALDTQENVAPAIYEEAGIEFEVVAVPPGTADMTPQMQSVVDGDPGVVFVVGNDSFCISAFNGLQAVGYDGTISAISQCITDATRDAVQTDVLDGMVVAASVPVGTGDPSGVLYETMLETFGDGVDASSPTGRGMYMTLGALVSALEGIEGEITPETATAAIKAMPEKDLPGAAGLQFRCNGNAYPETPAACVRGGLSTTLDSDGQPSTFEVLGTSPIED